MMTKHISYEASSSTNAVLVSHVFFQLRKCKRKDNIIPRRRSTAGSERPPAQDTGLALAAAASYVLSSDSH